MNEKIFDQLLDTVRGSSTLPNGLAQLLILQLQCWWKLSKEGRIPEEACFDAWAFEPIATQLEALRKAQASLPYPFIDETSWQSSLKNLNDLRPVSEKILQLEAQGFLDNLDLRDAGFWIADEPTSDMAISPMMIKGNDPEKIKFGSTLATNSFSGTRFDFMLSNPPYGKSWKSDQSNIIDGKEVIDHRFMAYLSDFRGEKPGWVSAVPRSSDGQLLFLMEMVDKMKPPTEQAHGSRIATVHNGSALFTGDAGGGESNIRRYLIEKDYLEAIIQLPNNLFYNTGITTYVWLLSNKKGEKRRGKVQLIDASNLYQKLRKNLGEKNCEFTEEHIRQITDLYLEMPNEGISKVFDNQDFGYYKVTVERPLRLRSSRSRT